MTALLVAALVAAPLSHAHPGCKKTFTMPMDTRAAWIVYAGSRRVRVREVRMLRRIARCQRRPRNIPRARRFNAARRSDWLVRRADLSMSWALVSYYTDGGGGACAIGDVQSGYRFASLFLPCGAMVRMCHGSNCVDAMMSDHGPYVGGRTFDLNDNLRAALGCGGLCEIRWRRL